ncbi:MAG: radical SAM/SPASM domain-containing protein [Gammaproteobacteria bacterium]
MYHTIIKDNIRRQGLLHGVMLELTYRCNLDCFFCYNDKKAAGTPLSVTQYFSLFDELAAMQVLFVTFTGGEPLVHPDFFILGRAARERGFSIRIKSNGHMIRGELARRLKEDINPIQVEMSLHGATAETHERQTRVPGSFARLLDNIETMQSLNLRPVLVSTLTSWNEHEPAAMFALADRLGVRLRFQGPVGPRDNGDTEPLQIQPSTAGWRQFLEIADRRVEEPDTTRKMPQAASSVTNDTVGQSDTHYCGAGTEEILVDPMGNVFPCMHLRTQSAGNLHDTALQTIWQNSRVFPEARELSEATRRRIEIEGPLSTLGAPLFCPGMEKKGCATCSGAEFHRHS